MYTLYVELFIKENDSFQKLRSFGWTPGSRYFLSKRHQNPAHTISWSVIVKI